MSCPLDRFSRSRRPSASYEFVAAAGGGIMSWWLVRSDVNAQPGHRLHATDVVSYDSASAHAACSRFLSIGVPALDGGLTAYIRISFNRCHLRKYRSVVYFFTCISDLISRAVPVTLRMIMNPCIGRKNQKVLNGGACSHPI